MKSKKVHDALAAFPVALILKVQGDAEQDAVDVAEFIRRAASRHPVMFPDFPNCRLPREALLGIKLVVRIQRWERNFITIHRDAGIPPANDVMRFVTSVMRGPTLVKYVQRHSATMQRLLGESILWSLDECDIGLDMAIVGCEDDQFLDAVAQLVVEQTLKHRSDREKATEFGGGSHDPSLVTACVTKSSRHAKAKGEQKCHRNQSDLNGAEHCCTSETAAGSTK